MKKTNKPFPATLTHLPKIMSWVRLHIEKTTLSSTEKKQVELALEEAIVNIIKHADVEKEFSLSCTLEPKRQIEFILTDPGKPFNPLVQKSRLDPEAPLHERNEGGLGIVFMKKYMDGVLYRREEDQNILTLIKNL